MRFTILPWFPSCCVNGPVAWLPKWTGSPTALLRLKEVVPLRITGMYLQSCCVCPCPLTLMGCFLCWRGIFAEDFLWVSSAGFGSCLILPAEWKWDILTGKHFFVPFFFSCYEIFFFLLWSNHVISLPSQWLISNFCTVSFLLSLAFNSDNFIHSTFQVSILKCENESYEIKGKYPPSLWKW